MKVLIIRFSSIGDIVLTTPVLRCLHRDLPGAELHYLTKQVFAPILRANPYLAKIHELDDRLEDLYEPLRAERFDLVLDLHHNLRTARIKKALGVKSRSYDKLNPAKWLHVNLGVNLMPDRSIVDRYLDLVRPLGVRGDGQGLDYFVPEAERTVNDDLPFGHWAGFVGCVIGGSYATKRFPAERWKQLIGRLEFPVALLGGPEDRERGEDIASAAPGWVYNACGKFSLNESADLVRRARIVISNDTGLMHVAAAFRKPVLSLWGNTSPWMGMFPYFGFNNIGEKPAAQSAIASMEGLYCHPCSKLGFDACPEGHFRCMNGHSVERLAEQAIALWQLG